MLHCSPSEALDLPAPDFDLLLRYFDEEPWGPWRDNMHAAIIAREVRRSRNPRTSVGLDTFMLLAPERRKRGHLSGFVDMLRGMAGGVKKHISELKLPKRRRNGRSRKASSPP